MHYHFIDYDLCCLILKIMFKCKYKHYVSTISILCNLSPIFVYGVGATNTALSQFSWKCYRHSIKNGSLIPNWHILCIIIL